MDLIWPDVRSILTWYFRTWPDLIWSSMQKYFPFLGINFKIWQNFLKFGKFSQNFHKSLDIFIDITLDQVRSGQIRSRSGQILTHWTWSDLISLDLIWSDLIWPDLDWIWSDPDLTWSNLILIGSDLIQIWSDLTSLGHIWSDLTWDQIRSGPIMSDCTWCQNSTSHGHASRRMLW